MSIQEKRKKFPFFLVGLIMFFCGLYLLGKSAVAFFLLEEGLISIELIIAGIILMMYGLMKIRNVPLWKIILALVFISIVTGTALLVVQSNQKHSPPKIIIYVDMDEIQYQSIFTDPQSALNETPWFHYLARQGTLIPPLTYHSPYGSSIPDAYMMVTGRTASATHNDPKVYNHRARTIFDAAKEAGYKICLVEDSDHAETRWLSWYQGSSVFDYIYNANKKGMFNDTIREAEKFIDANINKKVFVSIWWFKLDDEDETEEAGTHSEGWIEAVEKMDSAMGSLINYLNEKKLFNDTLFVITGDEGINDGPYMYSYGPYTKYEVFLLLAGPYIKKNFKLTWGWYTHSDAIATIAYLANLNMGLIDGTPIYPAMTFLLTPEYVAFLASLISTVALTLVVFFMILGRFLIEKRRARRERGSDG